jgi:hypothetical protein
VHRDVVGELAERIALGDEVGLAVQLDHDADLGRQPWRRRVQVGVHDALVGGAVAHPVTHLGAGPLADELGGLVEIALGVDECTLAVHHAGAGGLAEALDVGGGDLGHLGPL